MRRVPPRQVLGTRCRRTYTISERKIADAVDRMACKIRSDYRRILGEESLLVLCVLKGGFVFTSDLVRALWPMRLEVDFVRVKRYEGLKAVSPMILDELPPMCGRHVLVVDDIWDFGETLGTLRGVAVSRNPASVRTCVLLGKVNSGSVLRTARPDYIAITNIPDKFVMGYGLDYNGLFRNLPYVIEAPSGGTHGESRNPF